MALIPKQIGQSSEYYLLYEIYRKLDQLNKITANLTTTTTTTLP